MSIRIRFSRLNILLLVPYFELYTFILLSENDFFPSFFDLIGLIFSLMRTLISSFYILQAFMNYRKVKRILLKSGYFVLVFCASLVLTSAMNGSLYIMYLLGIYNYIGFSALCLKLLKENTQGFFQGGMLLFGGLSIVGCLSIFLFPMGFFNASAIERAVYFLGGKNSAVYYYLLFWMFYAICQSNGYIKGNRFLQVFLLVAMTLSTMITKSSSSLVCMLIVGIYMMGIYKSKLIRYMISPKRIIFVMAVLFTIVVFNSKSNIIGVILKLLGRSSTYTGRTEMWEQAIGMIKEHPFIGNGIEISFTIKIGAGQLIYPQAHNFFLDNMAKYGIIPIVILIGSIVFWLGKAFKYSKMKCTTDLIIFSSVFILHCFFDDMLYYYWILFISISEYIYVFGLKEKSRLIGKTGKNEKIIEQYVDFYNI